MPTVQFSMAPITGVLENYNIFSPMNYGAMGDNVTDDSIAVQACLTAAGAAAATGQGAEVLIDRMFYCTSNAGNIRTLKIPSNVTVRGLGWNTGIRFGWILASDGSVYMRNSNAFEYIPSLNPGNSKIRLLDMRLEGAHTGGPLGDPSPTRCSGILFRMGTDIEVRGCYITKMPGIALAHQGVSRFRALGNHVIDCGRDGITGGPYDIWSSNEVAIESNTIVDVHDDFIACNASVDTSFPGTTPPVRWEIVGNVCRGGTSTSVDNFARGILVSGAIDMNVVGNSINTTWQQGVFVIKDTATGFQPTRVNVVGNIVSGIGQVGPDNSRGNGIQVQGGIDIKIANNTIMEAARHGIQVGAGTNLGCDGFEIVGNTIRKAGWRGSFPAAQLWGMWITGASLGDQNVKNGVVCNNRVLESTEVGIGIQWITGVDIVGNYVYNNNQRQTTGSFAAGIAIRGSGVLRVHNNRSTDTQGVKTQGYGLSTHSEATTSLSLKDNYFQGNLTDYWIFNAAPTALHIRVEEKTQAQAWGAGTQTPDYRLGETIIATLSGNITVADVPALARLRGARLNFVFIQDGTGGRTVAWNAAYKVTWSNTGNTAGLRSAITFEYDGTNWCQLAPQSAYV